jgi:hypothetical protein
MLLARMRPSLIPRWSNRTCNRGLESANFWFVRYTPKIAPVSSLSVIACSRRILSTTLVRRKVLLMKRNSLLLFTLLAVSTHVSFAQGWNFVKGRFPEGKVTVFKLTETQKAFVDLVRRCQTDNTKTPYLFELTPKQSAVLRREFGFSPHRFATFESFRGDKSVDLEVNVINRFSEDEFEIPHKLLTRNQKAQDWEVNTMGWVANPLLKANPANFTSGTCPSAKNR